MFSREFVHKTLDQIEVIPEVLTEAVPQPLVRADLPLHPTFRVSWY